MIADTPFTSTEYVRPACLPSKTFKIEPTAKCIVSGWGRTSNNGESSPKLLYAEVPVHDRQHCARQIYSSSNRWSSYEICAGGNGPDTCQGDSGGPLVCKVQRSPNHPAQYVLGGVTSWGKQCGITPGVYTNVPEYIDWILENGKFQYNTVFAPPETTTTTTTTSQKAIVKNAFRGVRPRHTTITTQYDRTTETSTFIPTTNFADAVHFSSAEPHVVAVQPPNPLTSLPTSATSTCGISEYSEGTILTSTGEESELNMHRELAESKRQVRAFPWQVRLRAYPRGPTKCGGTLVSLRV
mgnify:CR=1 FL=1